MRRLINAAVGSPTLTNNGVGGSFACEQQPHFQRRKSGSAIDHTGNLNEWNQRRGQWLRAGRIRAGLQSLPDGHLSWLSIPSTLKTAAGSQLPASNWSADNTYSEGLWGTGHGLTMPHWRSPTQLRTQASRFRLVPHHQWRHRYVQPDRTPEVPPRSPSRALPSRRATLKSYTQAVGVAVLYNKTRAAGTYSVTVNVNSINSGTVSIPATWIAPPSITSTAPAVWVGGVTRLLGDWQQSATTAYDRDVQADVGAPRLLRSGCLLHYVNAANYFMSVAGSDMSGNQGQSATSNCIMDMSGYWIHPCNMGHQEIANAFLGATATPNYQAVSQYGQSSIYQLRERQSDPCHGEQSRHECLVRRQVQCARRSRCGHQRSLGQHDELRSQPGTG